MTTAPDFSHINLSQRPLVVSDVDDVVLEFLRPFEAFLAHDGLKLLPRSFKLTGNILREADDMPLDGETVGRLLQRFFDEQERWQQPFDRSVESLNVLAHDADIVFLTAMPPAYSAQRRRLLDRLGLHFPLIATEEPKGPVVRRLHGTRDLPLAFLDDMAHNLHSVAEHMPDCLLVQLGPQSDIHRHAPPPATSVRRAATWREAIAHIETHFRTMAV